jgi:hypothetical protein
MIDSPLADHFEPLSKGSGFRGQGQSELDILAGAKEMLEECHLLYVECPVLEYNAGAPRFDAYVQFLADLGFVPLQVLEQHLVKGVLKQFDFLFIRKGCVERLRKTS